MTETNKNIQETQDLNIGTDEKDMPKQQIELTQFADIGRRTDQDIESKPQLILTRITNPYPDQTPYQVLSRNYKVAEYVWGPATGPFTLNFPEELLMIPTIAERLASFLYMRAGVKIEVKINATQFHFGAFMISWIPNHEGNVHAANIQQQSGNRPIILSPAVQNSCTFNIPWINPYNYFNTADGTSNICRMWFTPLTPLGRASDNVTDSVSVQVYASFTDPEVAGYIAQSGTTMKQYVAQSGKTMKSESVSKSMNGVISTVSNATETISTILEKIPIVGGVIENLFGLISALDKPTSTAAMQPVSLAFARDLSLGTGLDYSSPLSLHPLTAVSMDYSLMGETTDVMSVSRVLQTPMIGIVKTFQTVNTSYNEPVRPVFAPPVGIRKDYLAFMTTFFAYWRGSIKYKLSFYTSTFTSCRFRVSILYNSTALTDDNSGDVVSRIVDVKGDTSIEFTVPYLWHTLYRKISDGIDYPQLAISQISPIIGPSLTADPAIHMVLWRAGGEDFKLNQLVQPIELAAVQSLDFEEDVPAQSDPRADFKRTFNPIIEGSCFIRESGAITGEHIDSLHDMCKRYCGNTIATETYPKTTTGSGPFHILSECFKYWRGSRRVKVSIPDDNADATHVVLQNPNNTTDIENGAVFTIRRIWPFLECEIPWYSTLPFTPIETASVPIHIGGDDPQSIFFNESHIGEGPSFISGGDDFTFGFLIAPR